MTVDEYNQAESKGSFTYWIESCLDKLDSICTMGQMLTSMDIKK